jgi:glucokinase
VRPASAFFAIAGPVEGPCVPLTNAPWILDAAEIGTACGFDSVSLINDFPPVAAALPFLEAGKDTVVIGDVPFGETVRPRVVLGIGTGCGASAVIPVGGRLLLQATEIGHTHLGPEGEEEYGFWRYLEEIQSPVSIETVLSGRGLVNLHRALVRLSGRTSEVDAPHGVLNAARAGDEAARKTLSVFTALLGRVAGDVALIFQARGGVYVGGGIVPRFVDFMDRSVFRGCFENKPPLNAYLSGIPTCVITEPFPALRGLAALASRPQLFCSPARSWVRA